MSDNNICPGCGRHCDLSDPHCGRGEEYRRTGKMPERRHEKEYCLEEEQHGKEDCREKERHGKGHRDKMRMEHYQAADINDKLIINLRDLSRMMHSLYEGKASQKRILMILNEVKSITQRDLTDRLGIRPGSASEILSKLESTGLIIRTPNETDRRTTDISLTDTGRELAADALAQRQRRHEEMFSCVSEEEKQELLSLLERICTDWRTRYCEEGRHGSHGEPEDRGCRDGHGHGHHEGCGRHSGNGYHEGHSRREGEGRGRRDNAGYAHHGGHGSHDDSYEQGGN